MAFLGSTPLSWVRPVRHVLAALVLGATPTLASGAAAALPDARAREAAVKAVFLFNFTRFVDWPGASQRAGSPLVIGVLGTDPFGPALDAAVKGEGVAGRRLVVKRIERVEDAIDCDEVFIAASEEPRLGRILELLEGKPVLTVSDIPGFAARGGMIGLVPSDGRMKIQINPGEAKAVGLRISSKLLRPAEIVSTRRRSNVLPFPAKSVVVQDFRPKLEPSVYVDGINAQRSALLSLFAHGGADARASRSRAFPEQRLEREDGLCARGGGGATRVES